MLQNNEKKLKMLALRMKILEDMKKMLEGYKSLGDEGMLQMAKDLGKDSEKLKKKLESMK